MVSVGEGYVCVFVWVHAYLAYAGLVPLSSKYSIRIKCQSDYLGLWLTPQPGAFSLLPHAACTPGIHTMQILAQAHIHTYHSWQMGKEWDIPSELTAHPRECHTYHPLKCQTTEQDPHRRAIAQPQVQAHPHLADWWTTHILSDTTDRNIRFFDTTQPLTRSCRMNTWDFWTLVWRLISKGFCHCDAVLLSWRCCSTIYIRLCIFLCHGNPMQIHDSGIRVSNYSDHWNKLLSFNEPSHSRCNGRTAGRKGRCRCPVRLSHRKKTCKTSRGVSATLPDRTQDKKLAG